MDYFDKVVKVLTNTDLLRGVILLCGSKKKKNSCEKCEKCCAHTFVECRLRQSLFCSS